MSNSIAGTGSGGKSVPVKITVEHLDEQPIPVPDVEDLQEQVRKHISAHDLFNWDEALTGEEMTYLENLLLTFAPIFYPGSIGFEKTVRPYLQQPIPVNQDGEFDKFLSIEEEKYWPVVQAVYKEVLRAKTMFKEDFVNQHEGYAVILEELDELWEEVKKNQKVYDLAAQKKEVIQCAAMCVRFAAELIDKNEQLKSSPSPTPVQDFWKDLFYRLEAIVIRLRNMNTNVIATNTYQNVLDEIKQLRSSSALPVQQKMDEDEFADWEQVNCGIGAAIAVFNECQITVPEDHPDPTAINDCISMTRDAQFVFNKLKKKYLEPTPVQEGLRENEIAYLAYCRGREDIHRGTQKSGWKKFAAQFGINPENKYNKSTKREDEKENQGK